MTDQIRSGNAYIKTLLETFPCVVVLGARQVGKSTLLHQLLPNTHGIDLENPRDFARVSHDPMFFLEDNARPFIIDEAQLFPELFSALRVQIDRNRKQNGQYLMSGSSSPELLQNTSDSLAGRVAIVELGTFSWEESLNKPVSNFYACLTEGRWQDLKKLPIRYSSAELYELCFQGGYPDPFLNRSNRKYGPLWMDNYIRTYLERDVRRLFPRFNFEAYRRFISMLAFSSGCILNFSDFARSLDVSQPTVRSYFDIASGTFLWRMLPSFTHNPHKRLVKMPKGYIRDSGLTRHLLGIQTVEYLKVYPHFGTLWESFVIEQLLKSFQWMFSSVSPSYYRTANGAEIDLILSGSFGHIPIEVKSGSVVSKNSLISIKTFMKEQGSPIGIVLNQAPSIEMLAPDIIQIPIGCL